MKVLVCSDSHGDSLALEKIVKLHPKMDLYLHLGDSCLPDYMMRPFITVKGNCDYFDYPKVMEIPTKFGTIHMEHGNSYKAMNKKYIESLNCFIYLFGHTHVKEHGYDGKTYVFNPGSLTEPRDSDTGSYLLVDIDDVSGKVSFSYEDYLY